MYYAIVHTRLIHGPDMYIRKFMEMYRHVYTFLLIYKHVCTWYRNVCMYIVQTCMYMFIQVYTRFDSYKHVHIMYKHVHTCLFHISYLHPCMSRYVLLMFRVQMATYISRNVQTSLNCVHTLMYAFVLPGWLACRQGLAAARCHPYSSSSTLVYLASA